MLPEPDALTQFRRLLAEKGVPSELLPAVMPRGAKSYTIRSVGGGFVLALHPIMHMLSLFCWTRIIRVAGPGSPGSRVLAITSRKRGGAIAGLVRLFLIWGCYLLRGFGKAGVRTNFRCFAGSTSSCAHRFLFREEVCRRICLGHRQRAVQLDQVRRHCRVMVSCQEQNRSRLGDSGAVELACCCIAMCSRVGSLLH